jgi:hypothetical protein
MSLSNETSLFFSLGEDFRRRGSIRADLVTRIGFADIRALTRGELETPEPLQLELDEGKKRVDWVGTTYPPATLISDQFVALLRDSGFTGLHPYPVTFLDSDGRPLTEYHGLGVVGRCGPIDNSRCRRVEETTDDGRTLTTWRGLYFDPSSWDGSDLFMSPNTDHVLATARVVDELRRKKLTGYTAENTSDIERVFTDTQLIAAGLAD